MSAWFLSGRRVLSMTVLMSMLTATVAPVSASAAPVDNQPTTISITPDANFPTLRNGTYRVATVNFDDAEDGPFPGEPMFVSSAVTQLRIVWANNRQVPAQFKIVWEGALTEVNGVDYTVTVTDSAGAVTVATETLTITQAQADGDGDSDGSGSEEDCDDNDPDVYPGAQGAGLGVDNDCNDAIESDEVLSGDNAPPSVTIVTEAFTADAEGSASTLIATVTTDDSEDIDGPAAELVGASDQLRVEATNVEAGVYQVWWDGTLGDSDITFTVRVTDLAGDETELEATATANTAPAMTVTLNALSADDLPQHVASLSVSDAEDDNNVGDTTTLSIDGADLILRDNGGGTFDVMTDGTLQAGDEVTFTLTATDSDGAETASETFLITVNTPATITIVPADDFPTPLSSDVPAYRVASVFTGDVDAEASDPRLTPILVEGPDDTEAYFYVEWAQNNEFSVYWYGRLEAGTFDYVLEVTDEAGAVTQEEGTFTIEGGEADFDEDGAFADVDCDDDNPNVHLGADRVQDGWDNDCDGETESDEVLAGANTAPTWTIVEQPLTVTEDVGPHLVATVTTDDAQDHANPMPAIEENSFEQLSIVESSTEPGTYEVFWDGPLDGTDIGFLLTATDLAELLSWRPTSVPVNMQPTLSGVSAFPKASAVNGPHDLAYLTISDREDAADALRTAITALPLALRYSSELVGDVLVVRWNGPIQAGEYTITATTEDTGGAASETLTLTVTVLDAPPTLTITEEEGLESGPVDGSVKVATLDAFDVADGNVPKMEVLPEGLPLKIVKTLGKRIKSFKALQVVQSVSDLELRWTGPLVAGTIDYVIRVTDSFGNMVEVPGKMTVVPSAADKAAAADAQAIGDKAAADKAAEDKAAEDKAAEDKAAADKAAEDEAAAAEAKAATDAAVTAAAATAAAAAAAETKAAETKAAAELATGKEKADALAAAEKAAAEAAKAKAAAEQAVVFVDVMTKAKDVDKNGTVNKQEQQLVNGNHLQDKGTADKGKSTTITPEPRFGQFQVTTNGCAIGESLIFVFLDQTVFDVCGSRQSPKTSGFSTLDQAPAVGGTNFAAKTTGFAAFAEPPANGHFVYTPAPGFVGTRTFIYQLKIAGMLYDVEVAVEVLDEVADPSDAPVDASVDAPVDAPVADPNDVPVDAPTGEPAVVSLPRVDDAPAQLPATGTSTAMLAWIATMLMAAGVRLTRTGRRERILG